jgi:hypothetical protein
MMTRVIANRNVTVTDHACPTAFLRPTRAPAKSRNQRVAVSQLGQTEPGFPVDVVGTTELHATFHEESRTSLFSASAALQEIQEATGLLVVFSQGKPHLATFIAPQ